MCFTAVSTVCVQKICLAQLVVRSALYTAGSMGIIVLGIQLPWFLWQLNVCVCEATAPYSLLCSLIPRSHARVGRVW